MQAAPKGKRLQEERTGELVFTLGNLVNVEQLGDHENCD